MVVNISSSSNDSFIPAHLTSENLDIYTYCLVSSPSSFIFIAIDINIILIMLPLCAFILYHGIQQWQQKRSTSSAVAAISHSDCFTYHMVTMELIGVFGYILNLAVFLFWWFWFIQDQENKAEAGKDLTN
ncbi:hypothetical protein CHARACLAT_024854 [Characodon lateralis]|uniref:Vomeronasal type-1 receptor n=1 Tax=Characodon lateralis TaxID=208331 RepID=A0ABU7DC19_9TELE|nr:hypothetical protein [Characodon lateralis]